MAWHPEPERDLALAAVLVGADVRASELYGVQNPPPHPGRRGPVRAADRDAVPSGDCPSLRRPSLPCSLTCTTASAVRNAGGAATTPRAEQPRWAAHPAALDDLVRRWFERMDV